MTRVAFLGLGAMGAPMARRILAAGFPLTVWNRNPERARAIEGATIAPTPRQAAAAADIVCTMLSDPAALQAVADGEDGLIAGLSSGKIWLDFSTVTPAASRRYSSSRNRSFISLSRNSCSALFQSRQRSLFQFLGRFGAMIGEVPVFSLWAV